jgi:tRNA modification GTPase
MDLLLRRVMALGARIARPGEFSLRAFLNDKIDLAQAEAIADLIDSASAQAVQSAIRSLQGEFSHRIREIVDQLIELRMYIESAIDFPDEEIDLLDEGHIDERLVITIQRLQQLLSTAEQGRLMREGMNVVIAGRPNAGKSSLLNRLARHDRAIVTDQPGTTRDILREQITIDGMPLHIIDTAGLHDQADGIEKIGIGRAWEEIRRADRVCLVIDDNDPASTAFVKQFEQQLSDRPYTLVRNKIDLSGRSATLIERDVTDMHRSEVMISARTGAGIELLCRHLKECAGLQSAGEGSFIARRRHLDTLSRALRFLEQAQQRLAEHAGELLAEDLRQAQNALNEITGEFTPDDLLGKIFASFCIGK